MTSRKAGDHGTPESDGENVSGQGQECETEQARQELNNISVIGDCAPRHDMNCQRHHALVVRANR